MLKLGIDIDGTIKDTHRAAIELYNRTFHRSLTVEDVPDFYLDQAYGLTREEGRKMWRKLEAEIYSLGVPLPHAQSVLNELQAKGHQITFITARPGLPKVKEVTQEWLIKHDFPYNGENLIMSAYYKDKEAKRLDIDLFFEDAPEHLQRLYKAQIPTVIMDASYNRDLSYPLPRIQDWREVPPMIENLLK